MEENLQNSAERQATEVFATTQSTNYDHLLATKQSELPARSHSVNPQLPLCVSVSVCESALATLASAGAIRRQIDPPGASCIFIKVATYHLSPKLPNCPGCQMLRSSAVVAAAAVVVVCVLQTSIVFVGRCAGAVRAHACVRVNFIFAPLLAKCRHQSRRGNSMRSG